MRGSLSPSYDRGQRRRPAPAEMLAPPPAPPAPPMLLLLLLCATSAIALPSVAATRRALEEDPEAMPNCLGCFNSTSGQCTVDTGNGISCSNATSSDCEALGEQYVDADPNTWPAGCLVQVAAKCMDDLDAYGCGSGAEKYTTHANSTEQCLEDAKKIGASVRRHPHSLCHCR